MASLRDSVKDYQEELRDGIAWVAFWKEGRSWNAELFHLEVDGTLEPFDRSRLEEIKAADPTAVILNGYYCGHLGENMSLDELTAGVRYHYENSMNDLDGFIGAHDDRLPPEVIEEARAAAHAAGLPFSEKPYRDGEDFDPYIFDGSMSIEDYELMHRMIEKERSEQMDEWKTGYSSYDRDRLDAADKMKIERGIYFETKDADISPLTALPLAELMKLREESAAAEQTVFENLKVQASAWEEQAGKTLLFDKAIEYARIPEVKHTANKWQDEDNDRHTISNRVYKMSYHVYENTRYDKAAQKSIPYSYTLSWNVYTNSPHGYGQAKIAGQDRKVFADRAAMEKYLNGRIKAYEKLFTEISPAIPQEYAEQFKVNGQLLPGYTVEGEEIKQPAADIPAAAPRTEPGQDTEQFAILIDSRTRFETGEPGGCWLSMPATKEELHEAMQSVGITADNPQEFFIHGYSDREDRHIALPYDMVCAAQVDELNFLAARLETLDASGITALNAATQRRNGFENIGQLIDFTYNEDFFVHIPEVHNLRELGDYYLNKSGMVQMPEEWKNGIDLAAFGKNAAEQEQGSFDFQDVCDGICRKLIQRHPHVFADVQVDGTEQVLNNWEQIKQQSKGQTTGAQTLLSVPKTFPALMRAQKVQKRAAKTGFEYPDLFWAMDDLESELDELQAAIDEEDPQQCFEELGDVLFSAVNIARFLKVDAEDSLNASTEKFINRFCKVEQLAQQQGIDLEQASVEQMEQLWKQAKNQ